MRRLIQIEYPGDSLEDRIVCVFVVLQEVACERSAINSAPPRIGDEKSAVKGT